MVRRGKRSKCTKKSKYEVPLQCTKKSQVDRLEIFYVKFAKNLIIIRAIRRVIMFATANYNFRIYANLNYNPLHPNHSSLFSHYNQLRWNLRKICNATIVAIYHIQQIGLHIGCRQSIYCPKGVFFV